MELQLRRRGNKRFERLDTRTVIGVLIMAAQEALSLPADPDPILPNACIVAVLENNNDEALTQKVVEGKLGDKKILNRNEPVTKIPDEVRNGIVPDIFVTQLQRICQLVSRKRTAPSR